MRTLFLAALACLGPISKAAFAEGDVVAGEKKFAERCLACHLVAEKTNKVGPYLKGVIGRPVAAAEGFVYSEAMKAFAATGAIWDEVTLDEFLRYPNGVVKDTTMLAAPIMNRTDRADLTAFLISKN
jgi:cytochrome c